MTINAQFHIRVIVCSPTYPDTASLLNRNGFFVWETKTLDESLELFRRERCHLIVVDYDVVRESQFSSSGNIFELISEKLCSAPCLVLFKSSIPAYIAEGMSDFGILPIDGRKNIQRLPHKIRKIIDKDRTVDLQITWPSENEISPPSLEKHELHWVVSHLLPRSREFFVNETKPRKSSIVLWGQADNLPEVLLVKIGREKKIKKEIENYAEFIKWRFKNTNYAHLEEKDCWSHLDLGGIIYTFVGANNPVEAFTQFYIREEFDAVRELLDLLFNSVLKALYYSESESLQIPLFDAYDNYLNLTDIINNKLPELEFGLSDPVQWVLANKEKSNLRKDGSIIISKVRTHGDLWGENILVERVGSLLINVNQNNSNINTDNLRVWLIDFERAGWGHALRDFVELEVDILTRLARIEPRDSLDFYELAICLTKSSRILEKRVYDRIKKTTVTWLPFWTEHIERNPEAQKAFKVIDHLRYLATEILHLYGADAREYYWGLLMDSLYVALNTRLNTQQRKNAAIYASVLAGRLQNWENANWPPDNWKKVEFKDRVDDSEKPTKNTNIREHMV